MKQETEIVVTIRNLHKFYGVGDLVEAGTLQYEVLDAQTTSNCDGTLTVHYQINKIS